jgi:hypothetical protein
MNKDKTIITRVTRPRPVIVELKGNRRIYLDPATIRLMGGIDKVLSLDDNAVRDRYYSVQKGVRHK